MKIGASISYQLIDIFNIIEDDSLSQEEKIEKVKQYQTALTEEGKGRIVDSKRRNGQNTKNGFYVFGNIDEMSYESLVNVKKYVDEVLTSLTCEGEMKMRNIVRGYDEEKHEIEYNFLESDIVYAYAIKHGKDVRGHTLVWHKHEPKKVLDKYIEDRLGCTLDEYKEEYPDEFFEKRKELTKDFLALYMKKMSEQYPDCYCWDVLNEIVPELEKRSPIPGVPSEEERKDGLRHSMWYEYLGDEFYIDVLEIARDNLPEGTKLFYNEFGEQHQAKRQAILKIIENIKRYEEKTGKKILDGIGLQSHYDLNVTPEQIEQIHREFSETGKEVQITEIDIMPGRDKHGNVREFDSEIFESLWKKVFECAEKYGIEAFTGWGIGDELNWFSHIDAIPTMVDKHGNIKGFAKDFIEKSKGKTYISMENVVRSAVENDVTKSDENDSRVKEEVIVGNKRNEGVQIDE